MNKNKLRLVTIILIISFLVGIFSPVIQAVNITAASAITIDHDTGDVLFEKDPDTLRVPASMTKVLTVYIIFEEIAKGNLTKDTRITVSNRISSLSQNRNYPAMVYLPAGKSFTVDEYIKLIMLPSASATCILMAEHISGSEKAFVKRMNETAKKMGLNAEYYNCRGAQVNYITARSMAQLISNFITDYPDILNYTSLRSVNFNGKNYPNTNFLLPGSKYEYKGADGFKTGTIPAAGHCLAATAKRNGRRIISVVMKSSGDYNRHFDSRKILDEGFNQIVEFDRARKNVNIEITNQPEELRLNSDHKLDVKLSNITRPHKISGGWRVNGDVVKRFNDLPVNKVSGLDINIYNNDPNREGMDISFFIDMPNGIRNEKIIRIPMSKENPAKYRDINNNWAEEQIEKITDKGVLSPYSDGRFGIRDRVTKGMFITSLGKLTEYLEIDEIGNKNSTFSDVKDGAYYDKYVAWGEDKNFINGKDGKFYPNDNITRAEMSALLLGYFDSYGVNYEEKDENLETSDIQDIRNWARKPINTILGTGLFNLYEDNTFRPNGDLSRAELANLLLNIIDYIDENIDSDSLEEVEKTEEVEEVIEDEEAKDLEANDLSEVEEVAEDI